VAWDVEAKPEQPQAAIDWFRRKLALEPADFRALSARAKRQAFTVAGATGLGMVQQVLDSLQKALEDGTTFESWQKAIPTELGNAWGNANFWRSKVVFDTAIQSAYGAGRWYAAQESERPYWQLLAVLDGRTSPICLKVAGFVAAKDDPAWQKLIPPLHFRCRTALITLSKEQAEERGIASAAPSVGDLGGFGLEPSAGEWQPNEKSYDPELWAAHIRIRLTSEIMFAVSSAKQYGFDAVSSSWIFHGADSDGIAAFVPVRNRIELNPNHVYWTDPQRVLRDCSSQDREHLVRHEVAHGRMFRQDPESYLALNTMRWGEVRLQGVRAVAARVSTVATASPGEFVSEVFAALEAGISYDDEVMQLYTLLHGGML
jgi:SPP1 gp7 family putative phage head morphogenesis protein